MANKTKTIPASFEEWVQFDLQVQQEADVRNARMDQHHAIANARAHIGRRKSRYDMVQDAGVRCGCEDYPCCGH